MDDAVGVLCTPSEGRAKGADVAIIYSKGGEHRAPSKPVRTPSSGHGVKTASACPSGLVPDGNTEGTGVC